MPSSRNTSPTVIPTAVILTHGSIIQMKPAIIRIIPTAKTHPQLRTPSAFKSNALTNREIPENKSQSVNKNGNDNMVNHSLNSRNSDKITVSTPSSNSQPEPISSLLVEVNTTISIMPEANIKMPTIKPAVATAMS